MTGDDNFHPVTKPAHYNQGDIECIDAMRAMATKEEFIGYLRLTAFKYLWRYRHKNGFEDLLKCDWYMGQLRAELTKEGNQG